MKHNVIVLFAVAFLATAVFAQVNTGSASGSVVDPSGAVVPAAKVAMRNQATSVETVVQTNQEGLFRVPFLTPGKYTLKVEAPGFRAYELRDMDVYLSKDSATNIKLEIGATTETVQVEASGVLMETSTALGSFNVESRKIMALPRLSSGLDRLALLSPGVVPGLGNINSNGVLISANGQRARSNNFLLDGQDNNDSTIGGPGFFFSQVEAVSEFQVITNMFSAEYGRAAGAIINITSRSGGNDFHGSANWVHRNDQQLTALTNFQRRSGLRSPPKNIDNVFGGTVGGPIAKDRIFFFGYAYRQTIKRDTRLEATGSNLTPTEAGLATLTRAFPNSNSVKALVNLGPVAQKIGSPVFLPAGRSLVAVNSPGGPVDVEMGRLVRTYSSPFFAWDVGTRQDINLSEKDRLNVRYFYQDRDTLNSGALSGYFIDIPARSQNLGATHTRAFSSSSVNEFRFSYVRLGVFFEGANTSKFAEIGKNIANFTMPAGYLGFGLATNLPQFRLVNRFQWQDNYSRQMGKHYLKVGAHLQRDNIPLGFLPQVNGQFSFSTFQNFVDNRPDFFNGAAGDAKQEPKQTDQFYYFQDDWKITRNLSLNLGMRYEYSGQPLNLLNDITTAREQDNAKAIWDTNLPLSERTVRRLPADKNNFAPRFGFAWTPTFWKKLLGQDNTVFRGGYSISYDAAFYNLLLNVQTATPTVFLYQLPGSTFPVPADVTGANLQRLAAPPKGRDPRQLSQTHFDPNFHLPYSQVWSFGMQRRVRGTHAVEVRYTGTRGVGQFMSYNGNPNAARYVDNGFANVLPTGVRPVANTACGTCNGRIVPNYSSIRVRGNTASSIYHGLQSRYDARVGRQLVFGTSYTYARTIDNSSEVFGFLGQGSLAISQNPFDTGRGERGLSNNHLKHAWSTNFVWDIPAFREQRGIVGRMLGGWSLAGIYIWTTGRPMQPVQFNSGAVGVTDRDFNVTFFGQFDSTRPFAASPNAPLRSIGFVNPQRQLVDYNNRNQPVNLQDVRWVYNNLDAARYFGTPFGVGRNVIFGPKNSQGDLSVFKNWKLRERLSITYRFEATNLFNHVNHSVPNLYLDSGTTTTFLNPTETEATPRVIVMGLRLQF